MPFPTSASTADVRRDDDVVQLPQAVVRRQWLRIGHIESCTRNLATLECCDQVIGDRTSAPADRDEISPLLCRGEEFGIKNAGRL